VVVHWTLQAGVGGGWVRVYFDDPEREAPPCLAARVGGAQEEGLRGVLGLGVRTGVFVGAVTDRLACEVRARIGRTLVAWV
jgi:hypothetical protein